MAAAAGVVGVISMGCMGAMITIWSGVSLMSSTRTRASPPSTISSCLAAAWEIDQPVAAEGAAIVDAHYGLQPVVQVGDPHIAWQRQVAVGGAEQLAVLHVAVGGLLAVQILRQPAGGALFAVVLDVAPYLVLLLAYPVVPVAAGAQGLGARDGAGGLRDLDDLGFFRLDRFGRRGSCSGWLLQAASNKVRLSGRSLWL